MKTKQIQLNLPEGVFTTNADFFDRSDLDTLINIFDEVGETYLLN